MTYGAVIVENRDYLNVPEIIKRHKAFLPGDWQMMWVCDQNIRTPMDYNILLTSVTFWESLPFDKALIFQHDSGLLRHGIEEFLQWDYIGAPWKFQPHGGNGGLSLRSKDIMIKILSSYKYEPRKHGNEDVYFSNHIEKVGGKLAPQDECSKFSVESIYQLGSLGYHAINKYLTSLQCVQILMQYEHKGNK